MQITSNHPVRVSGPTNIKNLGTGTLYYDSTQDVSSSNNEGSLTTNQSVDLADDKYVISSAISDILIDPYSRLAPLDLLGGTSGTVIGSDGLPVSVVTGSAVQLAAEPDLLIVGVITRDSNGAATSAPVVWPDGATGTYTGTASASFPGSIDAYTITHVLGGTTLTYTQPTMTRDASGNVTTRPAITVA